MRDVCARLHVHIVCIDRLLLHHRSVLTLSPRSRLRRSCTRKASSFFHRSQISSSMPGKSRAGGRDDMMVWLRLFLSLSMCVPNTIDHTQRVAAKRKKNVAKPLILSKARVFQFMGFRPIPRGGSSRWLLFVSMYSYFPAKRAIIAVV